MTARTSRLESASGSGSSAASDGVGLIGDSIGITDTQFLTITGTTPKAARFTTGTITIEGKAHGADLQRAPTWVTGLPAATSVEAAEFPAAREQHRLDHSTATRQLLEDTLNPEDRAEPGPGPSAATVRADRQGAIRRGEAPAWVAERRVEVVEQSAVVAEVLVAAEAGVGN